MAQRYRYVTFDRRDESATQFYIREVNGAIYFKLTRTDARILARLQAADFTQDSNPSIQIIDGENELGIVELLAPYDTDFGFRIVGIPATPLIEDSLYVLRPDWNDPVEYIVDPDNSKGWSPELGAPEDGDRIVLQVVDWLAGRGPKPQTGYLGRNGLVSDIADAINVRGLQGLRGAYWTVGAAFPSSPNQYDQHMFSQAVTGITALDTDGTTPVTTADPADVFNYNGTAWVKAFSLLDSLGTSVQDILDRLTAVEQKIIEAIESGGVKDLRAGVPSPADENDRNKIGIGREGSIYVVEDVTVDATDAAGDFNEVTEARFRGVSPTVPSNPQVGQYYFNSRDLTWYGFQHRPIGNAIDPLRTTLQTIVGGSVVFLGIVADENAARNAITNFDTNTRYYAVYGGKFYHLDNSTYVAHTDGTTTPEWIKLSSFTSQQLQAFSNRIDDLNRQAELSRRKLLDMQIQEGEGWNTATDATLSIFDNSVALGIPQFMAATNWAQTFDVPNLSTEIMHVVLRIPKGSQRSDYRVALPSGVLFIGDGSDGSSVSFFEHSSDATYAYCMVSVYVAGVGVGTTLTA